MKFINRFALLTVLAAISLRAVTAQNKSEEEKGAPTSGFRAEILSDLKDLEKKVVDLATAMPQEKYTWRPMEGVRSVSEVYMHIAISNFVLPEAIGIKAPEGFSRDLEKTVSEKRKSLQVLKRSFENLRQAILKTPDADLDKSVKLHGRETTVRGVFYHATTHVHEHLGQSIAYARMNNVVPPWSAEEKAQEKQKSKK